MQAKGAQKSVQMHNKKKVLPPGTFELKLGATVEIPRVGYPCIYVSQRFCADHEVIDAVARVGTRLYPAFPCVMDPAYCSVWNGDDEDEPKTVRIELLSAEAAGRLRPAEKIQFCIEHVDPAQFGGGLPGCDLNSYTHERLDGGMLQVGQKFELLCNGRQERVEVVGIDFGAEKIDDDEKEDARNTEEVENCEEDEKAAEERRQCGLQRAAAKTAVVAPTTRFDWENVSF